MSIVDILSGVAGVALTLRLSQGSATPLPINVATILEADFAGYSPVPLDPSTQTSVPGGFGLLSAQVYFTNNEPTPGTQATAMYVTAATTPPTLVLYMPLAGTELSPVPQGTFKVLLNALGYVIPGG